MVSQSQLLTIRHLSYAEIVTRSHSGSYRTLGLAYLTQWEGRDGTKEPASIKEWDPALQGMNLENSEFGSFLGPP